MLNLSRTENEFVLIVVYYNRERAFLHFESINDQILGRVHVSFSVDYDKMILLFVLRGW